MAAILHLHLASDDGRRFTVHQRQDRGAIYPAPNSSKAAHGTSRKNRTGQLVTW
jgi:hypothetical protein